MRRVAWAPLVLALALGSSAPAGASTVLELGVSEMAERSELVFVGRVVEQESRLERVAEGGRDGVRVLTETTFAIDRVLKGEKTRSFTLTQTGGTAGEGTERRTQVVHGQATFQVGEPVVLFLERTATGRLVPTGMAQGKYTVTPAADGGPVVVTRSSESPHTIKARRHRVRTLVGMPAGADLMTLPQLEALVRGERPAAAPVPVHRTPQVHVPAAGEAR